MDNYVGLGSEGEDLGGVNNYRRKRLHQGAFPQDLVEDFSDDEPVVAPVKRKRGRPPKEKKVLEVKNICRGILLNIIYKNMQDS